MAPSPYLLKQKIPINYCWLSMTPLTSLIEFSQGGSYHHQNKILHEQTCHITIEKQSHHNQPFTLRREQLKLHLLLFTIKVIIFCSYDWRCNTTGGTSDTGLRVLALTKEETNNNPRNCSFDEWDKTRAFCLVFLFS